MAGRRVWGVLLCGLAGCTDVSSSAPRVEGRTEAIVYGDDDRQDAYAVDDADLRELVRASLVALVPKNRLHRPRSGSVDFSVEDLASAYALCPDERFVTQPTAADCSGILIDSDLVLTAGHCIDADDTCDGFAYVFDYFYSSDGELETISSSDVYGCRGVVVRTVSASSSPMQVDYAVVQLDRPALGRTPVSISDAGVSEVEALTTIGFPSGLPAKIDRGGVVKGARNAMRDYFMLDSDTFAGSSGSGVFDAQRELVGVLVRGGDDYALDQDAGCYRPNVVAAGEDGSPWEQATYAVRARDALCALGYPSPTLCSIEPRCGDGFCSLDETSESCAADCTSDDCDGGACAKNAMRPESASSDTLSPSDAGVETEIVDAGNERRAVRKAREDSGCSAGRRGSSHGFVLGALSLLALCMRRKQRGV